MAKGNKQFVKGNPIKSTQSAGLAPRGTPVKGSINVVPHSDALEGRDIVQKGTVNARDNRYR